jgi:flagellar L-ring protein precursor FlgH
MKKIAACANSTRAIARFGFYSTVVATLAACTALPPPAKVDFAEARPQLPAQARASAPAATGSIYQNASYRPAFEDRRARHVGDTVTVNIVESLSASQVSKSTVNRNTSAANTITTAPIPGILGPDLANLNMGVKTDNDFSGKGGTEAANTFTGSITATVIEVQPNGHLLIAGEKQIGVNQNVDVMRFTGTVDPRQLQPGSVINSTQVANVRVESRGRGAQGEAQTVGWLSRFFLSFNPF